MRALNRRFALLLAAALVACASRPGAVQEAPALQAQDLGPITALGAVPESLHDYQFRVFLQGDIVSLWLFTSTFAGKPDGGSVWGAFGWMRPHVIAGEEFLGRGTRAIARLANGAPIVAPQTIAGQWITVTAPGATPDAQAGRTFSVWVVRADGSEAHSEVTIVAHVDP
jgi:hypothetical protein